jgi:hypothetical protein
MVTRLLGLVVVAVILACSSCPREGCDALTRRASGSTSGIGGVVASQSDVVENGCAECPFGDAPLDIYALSAPVTSDAEASAVVRDSSPLSTIQASHRYTAPLDPGDYLACVHDRCVSVSVVDGAVTTVNIKLVYGPTTFFVADADTGSIVQDLGLDVSAASP